MGGVAIRDREGQLNFRDLAVEAAGLAASLNAPLSRRDFCGGSRSSSDRAPDPDILIRAERRS
jgi:hypothetical protein